MCAVDCVRAEGSQRPEAWALTGVRVHTWGSYNHLVDDFLGFDAAGVRHGHPTVAAVWRVLPEREVGVQVVGGVVRGVVGRVHVDHVGRTLLGPAVRNVGQTAVVVVH